MGTFSKMLFDIFCSYKNIYLPCQRFEIWLTKVTVHTILYLLNNKPIQKNIMLTYLVWSGKLFIDID